MPDYTYLRDKVYAEKQRKAECAQEKHDEFINAFMQCRGSLMNHFIKDCRETVEFEVMKIYTIGLKEYLKQHSFNSYTTRLGIKKVGLIYPNYELFSTVLHTVQINKAWWHPAIRIIIAAQLSPEKGIIQTSTNYDEDTAYCEWYFPGQDQLDAFIDEANCLLAKDEIEVYKHKGLSSGSHAVFFALKANLGTLE